MRSSKRKTKPVLLAKNNRQSEDSDIEMVVHGSKKKTGRKKQAQKNKSKNKRKKRKAKQSQALNQILSVAASNPEQFICNFYAVNHRIPDYDELPSNFLQALEFRKSS